MTAARRKRSTAAKNQTPAEIEKEVEVETQVFAPSRAQKKSAGFIPPISPRFQRIVETIFDMPDPAEVFHRLRKELKSRGALTPQALKAELNEAESNALEAHRLYCNTRADADSLEIMLAPNIGAMRDGATAELQSEKRSGERSKQITDTDVAMRAAQMYPDEWAEASDRQLRSKEMLAHVLRLCDLWKKRADSIRAMLHAG